MEERLQGPCPHQLEQGLLSSPEEQRASRRIRTQDALGSFS